MQTYEPMPGDSITKAVHAACHLAYTTHDEVTFTFNGVEIVVDANELPVSVEARWQSAMDKKGEEYRKSPEYAEQQRQSAVRLAECQERTDALMPRLPEAVAAGPSQVVAWVAALSQCTDHTGVEYDRAQVLHSLGSAGYRFNDCVGHPAVNTDSIIGARWIIGQAMDGIASVGSPHPLTADFAERYEEVFR